MRQMQKQQARELLRSMEEAHNQIKMYIGQKNIVPAMELLKDCQSAGISLGTLIEDTEGAEHPTVSLLEEYCESAYQLYISLLDNDKKRLDRQYNMLQHKLIKTRDSIKNIIVLRKEVVFLPYKASMWDSLESVWQAAYEDASCDAYVIPIPYFDKNPDGSFRDMHYEGHLYPEYVPITSYLDYDFEARRPDAIYIHNPYDEYNFVTSVHPFFFSSNLKNMTEKLVYIPYFVLSEIRPDEEDEIKRMEHFVTVPAVFNAHKVAVQSENMRQIYIKVLLAHMNNYGGSVKSYWENKISGPGSPKFDKIRTEKNEDIKVPEEWQKFLWKSDGTRKKVVFYNTSITALLRHNDEMLEKMKYVFQLFKGRQNEVTLFWRPHPLIKATLESMRPQLWKKYTDLVKNYREEGWGIYDDTPEVGRAIEISDAYYGDGSSLVQLYQKTGKPVMIQNTNCTPFNWDALFCAHKIVEHNGTAWMVTTLFNGLFKLNLENGEIAWMGKIPNKEDDIADLFRDYLVAGNKIYFAPTAGENIAVYDIEEDSYQVLTLNLDNYQNTGNVATVLINGRELLFIGVCWTNAICRFSLDTKKLTYINLGAIKNLHAEGNGPLYGLGRCIKDNILYIPLLTKGSILKVDLLTEEVNLLQLTDSPDVSFTMAIYIPNREAIWCVTRDGYIVEWDEKNQEKKTIRFSDCDRVTVEEYITYHIKNGRLYLFPRQYGREYKTIDIYTGACIDSKPCPMQVLHTAEIRGRDYFLGCKEDGKYYVTSVSESGLKEEIVIHRKDGRHDKSCFDEYQINFFRQENLLYYEGISSHFARSVKAYLDWLMIKDDYEFRDRIVLGTSIGKRIWNTV